MPQKRNCEYIPERNSIFFEGVHLNDLCTKKTQFSILIAIYFYGVKIMQERSFLIKMFDTGNISVNKHRNN